MGRIEGTLGSQALKCLLVPVCVFRKILESMSHIHRHEDRC